MAELLQIPADRAEEAWPTVLPMLERVAKRGCDVPTEALKKSIIDRSRQLWVVWSGKLEGVLVTELAETAQGRVANLVAFAGTDRANWIDLIGTVEDWARKEGCVSVEIIGRKGWARILPGYEITAYVLNKRLQT